MEYGEIEKYVNDPSISEDGANNSWCIKTEAGGDMQTTDVGDPRLYCINTESDSCVDIDDVNNRTKTAKAAIEFYINDNTDNHAISCIKTEDVNIAKMDEHELHCIKREPAHNAELTEHSFHCNKTESPNLTSVSEHTFHIIETEYSSNHADVNNQTNEEGTAAGFDIKSFVSCQKPELQDDYTVHSYSPYTLEIAQREATNTESARVVMDCSRTLNLRI
jgi:hypothetical protein